MRQTIQIDPRDNVAVALCPLAKGTGVAAGPYTVTTQGEIPQGHKVALCDIPASGRRTCTEQRGFREISIFKDGVVL